MMRMMISTWEIILLVICVGQRSPKAQKTKSRSPKALQLEVGDQTVVNI